MQQQQKLCKTKTNTNNTNYVPFICFQFFYDLSHKSNTHALKSHLKAIDVFHYRMRTMFVTIEMHRTRINNNNRNKQTFEQLNKWKKGTNIQTQPEWCKEFRKEFFRVNFSVELEKLQLKFPVSNLFLKRIEPCRCRWYEP